MWINARRLCPWVWAGFVAVAWGCDTTGYGVTVRNASDQTVTAWFRAAARQDLEGPDSEELADTYFADREGRRLEADAETRFEALSDKSAFLLLSDCDRVDTLLGPGGEPCRFFSRRLLVSGDNEVDVVYVFDGEDLLEQ